MQEKQRLAQMVDELNDIVFSKTFKAPSAWADRERKYKMEKIDWETKVGRLQVSPPPPPPHPSAGCPPRGLRAALSVSCGTAASLITQERERRAREP